MLFEINGEKVSVPSSLEQISLGKFIEWYELHGEQLDIQLQELLANDKMDKDLKEIEIDQHLDKQAIAWMQFWTGFDFEELKDDIKIVPALDAYRVIRYQLKKEESETQYPTEFEFNGETWELGNYKVDPQSDMTAGEIITAKEVIRQLYKMGAGQYIAWLYLCCIFLRKKNERFQDHMVHEGSQRMELMREITMDIALRVGFFLNTCVDTWANTLKYFSPAEHLQMQSRK